jgi:hypothetical protein
MKPERQARRRSEWRALIAAQGLLHHRGYGQSNLLAPRTRHNVHANRQAVAVALVKRQEVCFGPPATARTRRREEAAD